MKGQPEDTPVEPDGTEAENGLRRSNDVLDPNGKPPGKSCTSTNHAKSGASDRPGSRS